MPTDDESSVDGDESTDSGPLEPDDVILTSSHRAGRRVPALEVHGVPEGEILGLAPLMVCDRIHWDTIELFAVASMLPDLGFAAWTRAWSDGQHRVWVGSGEGHHAREVIRAWCQQHDVEAVNMRVETGVPFRDLSVIPAGQLAELIAAAVDWLYPRMVAVRKQIVTDLDLVDDEDVRSMMYLFVSDHLDRFDDQRQGRNGALPLLAYLIGKLRTWPQDIARSQYGRVVVADRIAIARAMEAIAAAEQRPATELEVAEALGTSVTDLRRREQAIGTLSNMRNYRSLVSEARDFDDFDSVDVADGNDVELDATEHQRNAQLTRAIMAAVNDPTSTGKRAQDSLALAAVYLSFWEGMSRQEIARDLEVLPKTASAAVSRVLDSVAEAGLQ